jgi:hypothetical protein
MTNEDIQKLKCILSNIVMIFDKYTKTKCEINKINVKLKSSFIKLNWHWHNNVNKTKENQIQFDSIVKLIKLMQIRKFNLNKQINNKIIQTKYDKQISEIYLNIIKLSIVKILHQNKNDFDLFSEKDINKLNELKNTYNSLINNNAIKITYENIPKKITEINEIINKYNETACYFSKNPLTNEQVDIIFKKVSYFITMNESSNIYDLHIIEKLGEGTFGEVFKSLNKLNGKHYVVKRINANNMNDNTNNANNMNDNTNNANNAPNATNVNNEIEILSYLKNRCKKYVICYDGFYIKDNNIYIVTEYNKTLIPLDKLERSLLLKNIKHIACSLIDGLKFIHRLYIAHRDIKPSNILINIKTFEIKYIDFGLSCLMYKCSTNILTGTPFYIDPLLFDNDKYILSDLQHADIWGLGMTLISILSDDVDASLQIVYEMVLHGSLNMTVDTEEIDNIIQYYEDIGINLDDFININGDRHLRYDTLDS